MACQCDTCKYMRDVEWNLALVGEESAREFFRNMYDLLFHAQFELEHAEAVISGDWPSADEYIAAVRAKKAEVAK